jgi:hypothetical protein
MLESEPSIFPAGAFDDRPDMRAVLRAYGGKTSSIAKDLGIPSGQYTAFLRGHDLALDDMQLTKLRVFLNVVPGDAGLPECEGPYVLAPKSMRAAIDAYDRISCGGDLAFSFEARPSELWETYDQEGRVVLDRALLVFRPWGGATSFLVLPQNQLSDSDLARFINAVRLTITPRAYIDWAVRVLQIMALPSLQQTDQILRLNYDHEVVLDQLQISYRIQYEHNRFLADRI